MRRWPIGGALALVLCALGCHPEVEMLPLADRTIYTTDRFYDVQALGPDRAVVVGYSGKIVETTDGGRTWAARPSGSDLALYSVHFVDDEVGWISGQDGLILHTTNGGKTWDKQESNAFFDDKETGQQSLFLFGVHAIDHDHAWAVGDRSILTSTSDGGKTWTARKVAMETDLSGGQSLAASDPIFYDVQFVDAKHGWIVGEFGKIMYTENGGESWVEQEKTLMEGSNIFDLLDLPTMFGVKMLDGQNGLAVGLEGHIARTKDGGKRWTYDEVQVDYPLVDPLFSVQHFPDGTAWASGAAGEVVYREAGAEAWSRAKLGQDVLTWLRSINFFDKDHGWMVGGYGLIYRTTDGGKTWLPSNG
jgi:photosystem II stability/assembly factor-like uncharacterized protein